MSDYRRFMARVGIKIAPVDVKRRVSAIQRLCQKYKCASEGDGISVIVDSNDLRSFVDIATSWAEVTDKIWAETLEGEEE